MIDRSPKHIVPDMVPHCSTLIQTVLGSEDLKPENIMVSGVSGVSGEKEITLVDFGLAREAGKELEEGEGLREGLRGKKMDCIWEGCCFNLLRIFLAKQVGQMKW